MSGGDIVGLVIFGAPLALMLIAIVVFGVGSMFYAIGKGIEAALYSLIRIRREWVAGGERNG